MAEIKIYRGYDHYRDPVMDEIKTIVDKEGLSKKLGILSEITGVSRTTYMNWFNEVTRYPRYATVMATIVPLGYEVGMRRVAKFEVGVAIREAAKWKERQEAKKANAKAKLIAARKAAKASATTGATYSRS